MASPSLARTPTCLNCLRRLAVRQPVAFSPLSWTQIRGARTMTKAEEEDLQGIPVRLLSDIVGFGRKNSIIRVKPGRMRNIWHHKGVAEYMTKKRFQELGLTEAAIGVRDRSFGTQLMVVANKDKKDKTQKVLIEERPVVKKKEALTLAPEEAHRLLTELLPEILVFERKPIAPPVPSMPAPEPELVIPRSPALAANAQISLQTQQQADPDSAPSTAETAEPAPQAIFGSVSTGDVLTKIKEALLADQNGSRVALETERITILGLEEGEDRIKRLGRFEVDIVTGNGTVRRVINVVPEE